MADLFRVLDRQQNIEMPVHVACATEPSRYEFLRPIDLELDPSAKSCAICRQPLASAPPPSG